MTYNEWRDQLKNNLLSVSDSERAKVLDYYAEAYADRREAGFSESAIIEEFGAPFDAAQRILSETAEAAEAAGPAPAEEIKKQPEAAKTAPPPATPCAPLPPPQAPAKKRKKRFWVLPVVLGLAVFFSHFLLIIPFKMACRAFKLYSTLTMTSYTAEVDYTAVRINAESSSVRTEFYDGDKITIEFPTADGYDWSITDVDGVLTFSTDLKVTLFGLVKIPDAVIKLPETVVFDIEADIDAGSVKLADGKYKDIKVSLDAGSFEAETLICDSINCTIDAGSFYAKDVTCDLLTCDVDMGEIEIDRLTCLTLNATVDMGSAEIGMTGAKSEYDITASCSMGSSNITSQTVGSDKKIDVSLKMGSLEITFDN